MHVDFIAGLPVSMISLRYGEVLGHHLAGLKAQ